MLNRFFTSLKLTLTLLLGLAFVSVFGTLARVDDNRYEVFYQAPWFRLLLLLLAVNIAACTWKTLRRNLGDTTRFLDRITDDGSETVTADAGLSAIEADLGRKRFRVRRHGDVLLASRGRLGRWGSTVVHVALLIIMLGGILAEFGFVGTVTVPEGQGTASYYDWDVGQDRPLGFEFRVDHFELDYYPIDLKIGLFEPGSRHLVREVTTREGGSFDLPLPGIAAKVVDFDPDDQVLVLDILRDGQTIGSYRAAKADSPEEVDSFLDQFLLLRTTAFRDPIVRQIVADVSVLEDGRVVRQQRMMVNHPLAYEGVAFYQTAYNRDQFGFWYVGFQVSKDPGEPLVWAGSVLFVAGLLLAFGVRYRVLAVTGEAGDRVRIRPLLGMGDVAGRKLLTEMERMHAADDR